MKKESLKLNQVMNTESVEELNLINQTDMDVTGDVIRSSAQTDMNLDKTAKSRLEMMR